MRLIPFIGKKKRKRGRVGRPPATDKESWLRPETKRAIVGILLIVLGIVSIFSFIGQAGRLGEGLLMILKKVFGWLAYGSPVLFIYGGYKLVRPPEDGWPKWRMAGAALLVVGLLGVAHAFVPVDDSLQAATEGRGGGYLGFTLSYPLSLAISRIVAAIIFVASVMVGSLLLFNLSVSEVWEIMKGMWLGKGASEEDEGKEEENEKTPAKFRVRRMMGGKAEPDPDQLALNDPRAKKEKQQKELAKSQMRQANKKYTPPPLELLASSSRQPQGGDIEANKKTIEKTLANFNINVEMGKAKVGPTVTQYTFRPDEGVRLSQITGLQNDLARALAAHPVRIEAPIPNTDLVGIEIPNKEVALVRLRDLLASKEVNNSESPLAMALGKDVSGQVAVAELDRMPHMLIAGATNSGKSVCIHSILTSLIYRNSPALLRLVLVDPKRVELTPYNGLPHLWGEPVITDTGKTLNALKWALREMDRRYQVLEKTGSRNLFSYNVNNPDKALPFIVIVIDELADLMAKHAREVEAPIVRLAQLARAVGMHLVLATQRPSVNVITGLIKANVPARVAFKVASQVDSRTILDISGAEKLVGTGDMLFLASDNTKPTRLQGGFVSEEEVREVVEYVNENNEHEMVVVDDDDSVTSEEATATVSGTEADDPLFEEAQEIALAAGKVSASLLQRRLRVGYARAARILDMLEDAGIIGPAEGNKPREVLISEGDDLNDVANDEDEDEEEWEDER